MEKQQPGAFEIPTWAIAQAIRRAAEKKRQRAGNAPARGAALTATSHPGGGWRLRLLRRVGMTREETTVIRTPA
jgi:hypothetical protein